MTKALKVLAECVDARSGKRFQPGDEFQPVPTLAQANRLISAGCLPEAARELAEKADAEDEKKAEAAAAQRKKDEEAALAFVTARGVKSAADLAVEDAKAKVAQAVRPEEKTSAEKQLASAEAAAKKAGDELAKLTK